jgi:hypothetical protein
MKPRNEQEAADLAELEEWLAPKTAGEFAEAAYELARRSHGDKLPKFLQTPWHQARSDYREFLTFVAQYAMDSKPSR